MHMFSRPYLPIGVIGSRLHLRSKLSGKTKTLQAFPGERLVSLCLPHLQEQIEQLFSLVLELRRQLFLSPCCSCWLAKQHEEFTLV